MLLLAAAVFAGSQACRPCHAEIAEAYSRTPMARSAGKAEPLAPAAFTAAGHAYKISGRTLSFESGEAPVDYFIGSNTAGRSYLSMRDGFLYELPVTWYVSKQAWDASPGYESDPQIRLNRPVEPSCLSCHSSGVRPVLGTQNRYGDPPFLENGVACERCHGAGSEHVKSPRTVPMVNPATLDAERRDSVCAQCHLTGEARVERPGVRFAEFRAGERLSGYASYLVWDRGRRDLKVTSHVERLASSACKRASGDALWCGSCHGVHTNADRTQQVCSSCHASAHHRDERCATCHMPRLRASDANHGVMTDHSIPRVPSGAPSEPGGNLVSFIGPADDRALGIAYAEAGDPRAREHLLRAQPADEPVLLRLAASESDPARAAALYEKALRLAPADNVALVNLGALYAGSGRIEAAAALWQRALETNPQLEAAVLNLAKIRPPESARALLLRYLLWNPASRSARAALDHLH